MVPTLGPSYLMLALCINGSETMGPTLALMFITLAQTLGQCEIANVTLKKGHCYTMAGFIFIET